MRRALPLVLLALSVAPGPALAQAQVDWHGYLDLRVASPAPAEDWSDGGLGKTRFGGDGPSLAATAAIGGSLQLAPEWLALAELQYQPEQRRALDLLEGWVRWRPVSTTPWRWSARAGVFFPPVSLENDGIGWTSRWTLSPSAINSWVGEELRATGLEATLEHRGEHGTLQFGGALFGRNEPAGELLASRGWAIGDFTTGVHGRLRQPDVHAPRAFAQVPVTFRPFQRIDGALGAWGEVRWRSAAFGEWTAMHYDNRADPAAFVQYDDRRLLAWRTSFDAVGVTHAFGDLRVVAQWMGGHTAFEPQPGRYLDSEFDSAFVMAAWERGAWRPAVRVERFRVVQHGSDDPLSEDGHALTVAMNWRPSERWRFTAEWLRVSSERRQRVLEGLPREMVETQVQLSARLIF